MLNKLHLNNVHCTTGGMYLTGLKTGGMLLLQWSRGPDVGRAASRHAQREAFP